MDVNQPKTENFDEITLATSNKEQYPDQQDTGIGTDVEEIREPFDPTKIKIDARQMTIDLVINRIKFGEIDLAPDFQRDPDIWDDTAKSRLIESMLIRIPLPAFYIDATNENKWVVIDGQQRLTAIRNFVLGERKDYTSNYLNEEENQNKFRLSKLEFLTQLNNKTYDELPRHYQRRINETQITIYLVEKGTPEEVKFNIFKRINTGGLPLSAQEIRHALNNQGKVNNFLKALANSDEFKKATAAGFTDKRMDDREVVLRFLAFKITDFNCYNSTELDSFLNEAMKVLNKVPDEDLATLEKDFLKAMVAATDIFGNDAFRRRSSREATRSIVNRALFESWGVNLSSLSNEELELLKSRRELLIDSFIELNKDRRFIDSISGGTGDIRRVKYRFSKIQEIINKTLVTAK